MYVHICFSSLPLSIRLPVVERFGVAREEDAEGAQHLSRTVVDTVVLTHSDARPEHGEGDVFRLQDELAFIGLARKRGRIDLDGEQIRRRDERSGRSSPVLSHGLREPVGTSTGLLEDFPEGASLDCLAGWFADDLVDLVHETHDRLREDDRGLCRDASGYICERTHLLENAHVVDAAIDVVSDDVDDERFPDAETVEGRLAVGVQLDAYDAEAVR